MFKKLVDVYFITFGLNLRWKIFFFSKNNSYTSSHPTIINPKGKGFTHYKWVKTNLFNLCITIKTGFRTSYPWWYKKFV